MRRKHNRDQNWLLLQQLCYVDICKYIRTTLRNKESVFIQFSLWRSHFRKPKKNSSTYARRSVNPFPEFLMGSSINPMSNFYSGNRLLVGTCRVRECFCSCMRFVLSKMPALHRLNQPRALLFHTHNYATC